MSDLMLLGILRMPESSIEGDALSLMQFVNAARGAANRIEFDAQLIDKLRAELEAAAADKRDGGRYRWLRDNKHLDAWWSVSGPADRCANIDADIDDAMTNDLAQRQGEGS